jgi:hypothetical protein
MTNSQNKKTALFRAKGMGWLFVNLPYVCFLAVLAVIYIANSHAAEHNLRKIESLKKEVKDAEWKYMNIHKEIMYGSTQSQIKKKVESVGLKLGQKLPQKLDLTNS